jgi:hypothetical protein
MYGATYFHTGGSGLGDGIRRRPDGWALIKYIGRRSRKHHNMHVAYSGCDLQAWLAYNLRFKIRVEALDTDDILQQLDYTKEIKTSLYRIPFASSYTSLFYITASSTPPSSTSTRIAS